jgi:hypothetical protein
VIAQLMGLHYSGADNIHPVATKTRSMCVNSQIQTLWQPPAILTQAGRKRKATHKLLSHLFYLMESVAYMFRRRRLSWLCTSLTVAGAWSDAGGNAFIESIIHD